MAQKRHPSSEKAGGAPKIRTADDYRRAVAESQKLEAACEGTAAFRRRLALLTAMHHYELHHRHPIYYKGRPDSDAASPAKIADRVSRGAVLQQRRRKVD